MTPFSLLSQLTGLSQREAGEFLHVSLDTVKSWESGRRGAPPGALDELRALIAAQASAATQFLAQLEKLPPGLTEIEIGYPADDFEARQLGFSCIGAWRAMAARVVAASPVKVKMVPRGSTPATAAAIQAHENR